MFDYQTMESEQTTRRIQTEATRELRRAARDFPDVDVVASTSGALTLHGNHADIRELKLALWTRELSAIEYGQNALATADATARAQLELAT